MSAIKFWTGLSFLTAVLGSVGLLCLGWGVYSVTRGDYLTSVTVLGFAVFSLGTLLPLYVIKFGRIRPRCEKNTTGTVVRPDRTVDVIFQVAAASECLAMGLYAIFTPLGMVHIPVPGGMRHYFLIAAAIAAVWGFPSLLKMFCRGGVSSLRLTAEGFEIRQGLSSAKGAWEEVQAITARPPRGPMPLRGTIFIVFSDGQSRSLAADSYTPGGHALREWVRFYWTHPDRRVELTDGRALGRLRSLR